MHKEKQRAYTIGFLAGLLAGIFTSFIGALALIGMNTL